MGKRTLIVKRTLLVKNVSIPDDSDYDLIGDCLLCGSVGSLTVYPSIQAWDCDECGEQGYYDNIQIKMKLRDDN